MGGDAGLRAGLRASGEPLVLIVEDSKALSELAALHLQGYGYRTLVAPDGATALQLVAEELPDLVLLDLSFPGELQGFDVLERLVADERVTAPVLIMSGSADEDDVLRGLTQGAHDYLVKPVEPVQLLARCAAALRAKHTQDALREAVSRLERDALTDALTGQANRRLLRDELMRADAHARRHHSVPALLAIDLDGLKAINDEHGHAAGDDVIAGVAQRIATHLRRGDLLARTGGDEFVVLLFDAMVTAPGDVGERLRLQIAGAPIPMKTGPLDVTISVGWALWRGDPTEGWLARADGALYVAKRHGRNCVRELD